MNNQVEIIHLSPKDWKSYRELRLRALKTEPQAFGKSYKEAVNEPYEKWRNRLESSGQGERWSVFAKFNGKLIGMIEASIHSDDSNKVWLHATYVDKNLRGQGFAKKLMEQIISDITNSNAPKKLKLGVNKNQTAAIRLYKEFGFEVVGEQDYIMGDNKKVRELLMEKQL